MSDQCLIQRFCVAICTRKDPALGEDPHIKRVGIRAGANLLMHLHPVLNELDVYGHGKPTRLANATRDVLQPAGSLPRTETIPTGCFSIPWFKHDRPQIINEHAEAFRKVCMRADELVL